MEVLIIWLIIAPRLYRPNRETKDVYGVYYVVDAGDSNQNISEVSRSYPNISINFPRICHK
jgi:hypothetical protein